MQMLFIVAMAKASVRLSLRLFVTLCNPIKTTRAMITKSLLWAARKTLVSGFVKLFQKFKKGHPT